MAASIQAQVQTQAQHAKEVEQAAASVPVRTREEWIGSSPHLPIVSDHLHGSIALKGLRFDDLTLAKYRETQDKDSKEVVLFSPLHDKDSYFAEFGWMPEASVRIPDKDTVWTASGSALSPGQPVTLYWNNGAGITFSVAISLDDKYMFTLTQSAKDAAGKPVPLQSYAYLNRAYDIHAHSSINILHEGPISVLDGMLKEVTYKDISENKEQILPAEKSGWLGISDKYWFASIIPPEAPFSARIYSYYAADGRERFQTEYSANTPQPETTLHFFAGAKELPVLVDYASRYHIVLFDRAVDFGFFYFLTKPIFLLLNYFHGLVGNFGIAIMLLTVVVKLLMFPLANKAFKSANEMKEWMPKLKELQERYKDDLVKFNQERMELYKREKINPAAGCLPALIQFPVFFSLYKVLYVTLEMRQAPFFGWIQDLSLPDPTNVFTLFGLLHWHPPGLLHVGVWPLLMCLTMIIQQKQSPVPPDPTQAKMIKYMPYFFLFLFSSVAAGLVIYWTWSNILSILQQWTIRHLDAKAKRKKLAA